MTGKDSKRVKTKLCQLLSIITGSEKSRERYWLKPDSVSLWLTNLKAGIKPIIDAVKTTEKTTNRRLMTISLFSRLIRPIIFLKSSSGGSAGE